ncbi:hypothetical protein GGR41_000590 [Paenalcaligenes hominis]|uniref:Uncharacterized protein n=1 Tax=Paenalcaligenes hominis TaxID=643674 RepID=A0ABX0WNJ7_9BURK|nr:hypothetical protein [Paenalcaligenes hominis]NJB64369.1 hypothetical protein [Paenalcaligenes hominis]GGE68168.1 hypothetical protein GCM10007278_15330 [Paenalcaligenes hominis]
MFKKTIVTAALVFSAPLYADSQCVTKIYSRQDVLYELKKQGWGYDNYDLICEKMRAANAEFLVSANAMVVRGKSVTWAVVSVKGADSSIVAVNNMGHSTLVDDTPSTNIANSNYMVAIDQAIGALDIDKAIADLNEARRNAK